MDVWIKMPERTYIFKCEKYMHGLTGVKDHLSLLLGGNAAWNFNSHHRLYIILITFVCPKVEVNHLTSDFDSK
jgi:hypothetical protein